MWAPLGVQMQTTSRSGLRESASRSSNVGQPPLASPAILSALAGLRLQAPTTRAFVDLVDRPRVKLGDHAAADDAETVLSHRRVASRLGGRLPAL